jgi:outer membrane lipoprotein carrier protein
VYVKQFVSQVRLIIGLVAVSAFASDPSLEGLLKGVEARYNRAKTLQVLFQEDYTRAGEGHRPTESGILMLRKPGRMRWAYTQPKGKLWVSDNKSLWLWLPDENRAEQMKLQESDDMRAPLAFLLGKLYFDKEFRNLRANVEGLDTRIKGEPKTDTLPYSEVQFLVAPDYHIREVKVTGFDKSILEFRFEQERLDPKLDDKLFQFQVPKGAELIREGQ